MTTRDELERRLSRDLGRVESTYLNRLVDLLGEPPSVYNVPATFWSDYATELNRVLSMALQDTLLGELQRYMDTHPIGLDVGAVVNSGTTWSREYITQLAQQISDNSRTIVANMVQDAIESGLTTEDLTARLATRFGPAHAEMIAITETTRANSQAATVLQERLADMGLDSVRRWLTAEDEKVCELCGPMDHVIEDDDGIFRAGGYEFDEPPDPHPRCRCQVAVETVEASG